MRTEKGDANPEEDDDDIIVGIGRPFSEKDQFYLDWAKDMLKGQFVLCHEVLKQIITLCVALLSVSVIFDKLFEHYPDMRFFTVLMLFISLVAAFAGIYPFESEGLWLNSPKDIEKFQRNALHYKKACYKLSTVFLVFGAGVIVVAVLRQVYRF